MCSVLVSAHGLFSRHIDFEERVKFLCNGLFSAQGLLFRHMD